MLNKADVESRLYRCRTKDDKASTMQSYYKLSKTKLFIAGLTVVLLELRKRDPLWISSAKAMSISPYPTMPDSHNHRIPLSADDDKFSNASLW